jgi:hypothetical protein
MSSDSAGLRRLFGSLLLVSVVASFAAAGCSDITPEPNDTGGGVIDSPTHEADQMHQMEEQQQEQQMQEQQMENRMGGGGGGGARR